MNYWAPNGSGGNNPFATLRRDYQTPFGTLHLGDDIYSPPSYLWSSPEFLTRLEVLFESNYPKEFYNGAYEGAYGPSLDLGALVNDFNGQTPLDSQYINQLISDYKENIYGFNKRFTLDGFLGLAIDRDHAIDNKRYEITNTVPIDLDRYNNPSEIDIFNTFSRTFGKTSGSITTGEKAIIEIPSLIKPVQFRFNTDFTNVNAEEIINGYVFMEDTNSSKYNDYNFFKTNGNLFTIREL